MLLSPQSAPRQVKKGRSKSWGTDLHDVIWQQQHHASGAAKVSSSQSQPTSSLVSTAIPPAYLALHHAHHGHVSLHDIIAVQQPHILRNKTRDGSDLLHGSSGSLEGAKQNETTAGVRSDASAVDSSVDGAWALYDTWQWYNRLPWLAGMNYLPRTAVNFIEMWDPSTFDPQVIEEELNWAAEKLGYNTLRTNLPMVLYEADAAGLTKRVNKFLRIAARCGFCVCLVPLDDCEFSGKDPVAGKQPDPVPNLHNSQAIGSPGRKIVMDPSQWFRVEEYIRFVVRTWGQDRRVILMDLYNEPANPWVFTEEGTYVIPDVLYYEDCALKLMEKVFEWAREEKPMQPLTVSAWHMPDPFFEGADSIIPLTHPIDLRAMQLSDVISVHAYCNLACLQSTLQELTVHGKPILLTEWMARQVQSTYDTALPTLKELKVGAYQWGLVRGKSQTNLPWPHVAHKYTGDPMWWHDVLDVDGTLHNEEEGELIRSLAYPQNKALSSELFLADVSSHESLEHLAGLSSTPPSEGSFLATLEEQQPLHSAPLHPHHLKSSSTSSLQHMGGSHHHHHMGAGGASNTDIPTIHEDEQQIIPSVCSISMATINAAAAQHAGESTTKLDMLDHHSTGSNANASAPHPSKSMPTFGNHMRSPSIEGLDLAEMGGIEF